MIKRIGNVSRIGFGRCDDMSWYNIPQLITTSLKNKYNKARLLLLSDVSVLVVSLGNSADIYIKIKDVEKFRSLISKMVLLGV